MSSAFASKSRLLGLACFVVPMALAGAAASAQESRWQSGEQVYQKVCGHCHETSGAVGPDLKGRGLPPAYISAIVRQGFRAMPAFPASQIDDTALQLVGEYIQQLPAQE